VSLRNRVLSFGGAALLIVLGGVAALAVKGITGEAIALALFMLGSIAIVSLVFLEIGLSEDRDRAREQRARNGRPRSPPRRRRPE
jgi:hypothetical protein